MINTTAADLRFFKVPKFSVKYVFKLFAYYKNFTKKQGRFETGVTPNPIECEPSNIM